MDIYIFAENNSHSWLWKPFFTVSSILNIVGCDFAHKILLAQFAKIVALLKILCTFSIKLCRRSETGINNKQFGATPNIYYIEIRMSFLNFIWLKLEVVLQHNNWQHETVFGKRKIFWGDSSFWRWKRDNSFWGVFSPAPGEGYCWPDGKVGFLQGRPRE